jgi:hypothetical protein
MHLPVLVHLQWQRYIAASALRAMSLQSWQKTSSKSIQSLHTDRQFVQWLTLKHIVSIFVFIGLFLHLINSQYGVWKHLPILGAGFNQRKQHFFNIYGIVNWTPHRQGLVQRMIILQLVVPHLLATNWDLSTPNPDAFSQSPQPILCHWAIHWIWHSNVLSQFSGTIIYFTASVGFSLAIYV